MLKMASAKVLEEALSTDVDESAMSAVVSSLKTQFTIPSSSSIRSSSSVSVSLPHRALLNSVIHNSETSGLVWNSGDSEELSSCSGETSEESLNLMSNGANNTRSSVVGLLHHHHHQQHQQQQEQQEKRGADEEQQQEPPQQQGGPTMTVNVTSGSTGVTQNNNNNNNNNPSNNNNNKSTVLTINNKPSSQQVGMTMTMAPISTSLASMSPAPASTVVGSNSTIVNSLESHLTSSPNLMPNINNHLSNRSDSDANSGKTVLVNNVIPHNISSTTSGGTPNGLQSLGVHSAGSTTNSGSVVGSVLNPQHQQQQQQQQHHLTGLTGSLAGSSVLQQHQQQGNPTNPNNVVLGKHSGLLSSSPSSNLASLSPASLGPSTPITTLSGSSASGGSGGGGALGQSPTIISAAGGGLRILNMNAVQAAAAVGAGSPAVQAAGVQGNAAQKALAPRMIISPQMIGARPGQPGVQEYESEFSEFLMLNYKQNVNEESGKGSREDDCIGDPLFTKETESDDNGLAKHDAERIDSHGPLIESEKSKELIPLPPSPTTELSLESSSKLCDSSEELFPEHHPSLTLTPIGDEGGLSPNEKSDCPDMSFLQEFSTPYDCVQEESAQSEQIPDSLCSSNSASNNNNSNNNLNSSSSISDSNNTSIIDAGKNIYDSNESTFFSASQQQQQQHHQEHDSYPKQSETTELPDNSKLPAATCQLAVPSEVAGFTNTNNPEFSHSGNGNNNNTNSDSSGARSDMNLMYNHSSSSIRSSSDGQLTKDYEKQSGIISCSLPPHTSLPATTTSFLSSSSPNIRYTPSAPYSSPSCDASMTTSLSPNKATPQQQYPIQIRVPPQQQPQHIQNPQQQQQQSNTKFNAVSSEYKTKCFTTDAQLQSQFLRYNQQHPIGTPTKGGAGKQPSRSPVNPNLPPHPSTFPQQQQHPYSREMTPAYVNQQGSVHGVGPTDNSSRMNVQQQQQPHGSIIIPASSYPPRPNMPTSGCEYFPQTSPSTSSSSLPPYGYSSPPGGHPHLSSHLDQQQHHLSQGLVISSHNGRAVQQQPQHSPNLINPMISPTRATSKHHHSPNTHNNNSFNVNPRWMAISPNNSSGSGGSPGMSKYGSSPVIRYGSTHHSEPSSSSPSRNNKYPHIRYHSPVGGPQVSPNHCQYPVYDNHRMSSGSSGNRYPGPAHHRPSLVDQGGHHPNVVMNSPSSNRVQSMSQSRPPYPPQQHYAQEHYIRASSSSSGQYMQNHSSSQYFQPSSSPSSIGGSQSGSNTNNSNNNNSSSSSSNNSSNSGPQHPGFPLVCRVSPIRSRYEDASNFRVNSYSQSPSHHYPLPHHPHLPPPGSTSVPGSIGTTAQDPILSYQQTLLASGTGRQQDFNYPYESQYSDARNMLRTTPFTLQALSGLPPGAQGHHLLVKTENGQYQLLRVGMPPQPQQAQPNTAASGTNPSPSPIPSGMIPQTTSIAQSSSSSISSSLSSSSLSSSNPSNMISSSSIITPSSTVMTTPSLQQHHHHHQQQQQQQQLQQPSLTTGMSPLTNNNANIVTSSSGAVMNSIMGNAVGNSPRLPMASTTNLVHHTNNISAVVPSQTASSTSAISSTTIPSPVLPASPHATTTYRLQTVPTVPPTAASNSSGMGMPMQPQMYPQHPQTVQGSPSVASNTSATANSVSQMTAETAKMKCKNFLSFLLELSAKQNATVARNVKTLIQGLVDGKVNAEDFSDRLQKEVNSQPQPCLVGFLKKSLPHLRQSLATKELTIDGIKAPALSSIGPTAPVTALIPQNQVRPQAMPTTPVRIITPINASPSQATSSNTPAPIPRSTVAAVQQRFATPSKGNSSSARSNASSKSNASSNAMASSPSTNVSSSSSAGKSGGPSSKSNSKDKDKKGGAAAAFSGYSGDDDINDVAAMGGVNLAEESQRILGSTEFVGTQIRSCKDEAFLPAMLLQSRIKATAAKYGLEDSSSDVAAMISHATEERLKNLLEKLSVIAEHRLDVIKVDERYEISQDVKGQLRFLEELDKLERKRHDEQEREILIKAAKSRSKSEDPEQAKLKAKAKEMQRVALEEMRQREANLTALQAIGPRKKPKLDTPSSQSTTAQTSMGGQGASNSLSRSQIGMRPRLKRVNLRDLLFLMEQDKETQRSHFLYKNLLLK